MTERDLPEVDVRAGGEFLTRARQQKGLRQSDLIENSNTGMKIGVLSYVERGNGRDISLGRLVQLSEIYDISVSTIVEAFGVPMDQELDPEIAALGGLISQLSDEHKQVVFDTTSLLVRQLKVLEEG